MKRMKRLEVSGSGNISTIIIGSSEAGYSTNIGTAVKLAVIIYLIVQTNEFSAQIVMSVAIESELDWVGDSTVW